MPLATINGVTLSYEIVGRSGASPDAAMALVPGGRNPLGDMLPLAERMAAAGYQVLLHDRRNCGASDVAFDGSRSEYEVWADDLHALLASRDMLPAVIGGSSSGARLALVFAMKYRQDVRALLLARITGGKFAADRLIEKYYDQYLRVVESGGMVAVAETEHFAEVIRNRPANRARLLAVPPQDFAACMKAWRAHFLAGADDPLIGTSVADLRSIRIPTCVIPGNDLTHPSRLGAVVAGLMPDCELDRVSMIDNNVDVTPPEEWKPLVAEMAAIYAAFLARRLGTPNAPIVSPT